MTKIKTERVPANRKWTRKQLDAARIALNFLAGHFYSRSDSLSGDVESGIAALEKMWSRAIREFHKKVTVYRKPKKKSATKNTNLVRVNAAMKRELLKGAGWKREDHTQQGDHIELWIAPGYDRYGFRHGGVGLDTAWKTYLRTRNRE